MRAGGIRTLGQHLNTEFRFRRGRQVLHEIVDAALPGLDKIQAFALENPPHLGTQVRPPTERHPQQLPPPEEDPGRSARHRARRRRQ